MDESFNMNELTMYLHDSYQTIRDRIKRIELKMDAVECSLKVAQVNENVQSKIYEEPASIQDNSNMNKFSNLLKLYEYQIIEMQHENELLLEDKVNLKLLFVKCCLHPVQKFFQQITQLLKKLYNHPNF